MIKNNYWKCVLRNVRLFTPLLVVFVASIACISFIGGCKNVVYYEVPSLDNSLKAVVFSRDCGATTNYSTHISILRKSSELNDNQGGNIFIAEWHPQWVINDVSWISSDEIKVEYVDKEEYKIHKQKHQFLIFLDVIKVSYKPVATKLN